MMELVTKMAKELATIYGYKHITVKAVKEIDCTELQDNLIGLSFDLPMFVVNFYNDYNAWVNDSEGEATAFVAQNGCNKTQARTFMFFGQNNWGNGTGNFTLLDVLPVKVGG